MRFWLVRYKEKISWKEYKYTTSRISELYNPPSFIKNKGNFI